MVEHLESKLEAREDKLALKEKEVTDLKAELNSAKERLSATRARAVLVQHKAKKLEKEKEHLQNEAKRMEDDINVLKKTQSSQMQSFDEARKDFQILIDEKERLLRAVHDKLGEKEKELDEHKKEMEGVRRKLEEADKEVGERNGRIMELERERAELRAEIQSERKTKDELLQKAFSMCLSQNSRSKQVFSLVTVILCRHSVGLIMCQDDSGIKEQQAQADEVSSLTRKLVEKDKEIFDLTQHISQLEV